MVNEFIPYGRQSIEEDDIAAVTEVLRSPYLTTGPKVKEFETAFTQHVHAKEAIAVSSGTAGLHAAMSAAGIGPGDEVLVPTLSFLATANAAVYVGAKPVFVDSVKDGFNMDVTDAERKITTKTKAIVPVHFAGQPVDMDAIHALAKKHSLIVIEDAAHALGAEYQGRMIGSLSDLTVFSFHPVKHITTAEGGMVTCADSSMANRLRSFRHHGIDMDVVERDAKQKWYYDMADMGYNYRLSDVHCALGLSQLRKANRFLQSREAIAAQYDKELASLPYVIRPPQAPSDSRHAWHLYVIRLDLGKYGFSRDEVFSRLRAQGIGAHVHYRPIHLHSFYRKRGWKEGDCPHIETTFPAMLSLPIFQGMTEAMIKRVISSIKQLERVKV